MKHLALKSDTNYSDYSGLKRIHPDAAALHMWIKTGQIFIRNTQQRHIFEEYFVEIFGNKGLEFPKIDYITYQQHMPRLLDFGDSFLIINDDDDSTLKAVDDTFTIIERIGQKPENVFEDPAFVQITFRRLFICNKCELPFLADEKLLNDDPVSSSFLCPKCDGKLVKFSTYTKSVFE